MKGFNSDSSLVVVGLVAVLLVVAGQLLPAAEAVTCSPTELSPCVGAISSNARPSNECCTKLNQQRPCLCGYIKNPSLQPYVNSPGARRVAAACRVPIPSC